METSAHWQRALVLYQQNRHVQAEQELRQHLTATPGDASALAMLSLCLLEQEKRDEAEQTARESIAAGPDMAFAYYALARVLSDRNREDEAANVIEEAIRLEPEDADYHGTLAGIEFARRDWQASLSAAETGLQFNPEHVACNNLRAMALVKLGRKQEAGTTISQTLARDPDNSITHANKGWTLLETGQRKQAMHHFRESLRIDPENEWAKAGLVEALKAGNPIYAVMLKYFLWTQKLSSGARWGIILGGYFGSRMLSAMSKNDSGMQGVATVFLILYSVFAILTWLAHPVFNLLLFLHPMGRHALNDEQRAQARWVGICIFIALLSLGLWMAMGGRTVFLLSALVFGLLTLPVSAIHGCESGWPRMGMVIVTLLLLLAGSASLMLRLTGESSLREGSSAPGAGLFGLFCIGIFLSQWVAIWLMNQRPTR